MKFSTCPFIFNDFLKNAILLLAKIRADKKDKWDIRQT